MLLKRLLILSLLLILSSLIFAEPLEFTPPVFQEGDNEEVTVTIGNMRQALYYKETAVILKKAYNKQDLLLTATIKDLATIEARKEREKKKKIFYRAFALLTTGLFTYEVLR